MAITNHMGITSHMHITHGMDTTGLFVARGGKGVDWSMVTIRMSGRLNIIDTDRPPMATGERDSRRMHFVLHKSSVSSFPF